MAVSTSDELTKSWRKPVNGEKNPALGPKGLRKHAGDHPVEAQAVLQAFSDRCLRNALHLHRHPYIENNNKLSSIQDRRTSFRADPPDPTVVRSWPGLEPQRSLTRCSKQAIRKALLDIMGGVHCQPLEMPQAFDSLLQTTQMYANSKRVRRLQAAGEARYISHPATWFNAEEYLVDPAVWESDERRNG
jgi:hypothetical protein